MERRFYLVQRLKYSPSEKFEKAFPGAKVRSNPFGYGRLGDYELDYMGAAEFEYGAITEGNNYLAGKQLTLEKQTYNGNELIFLYVTEDGSPFDEWKNWIEGTANKYHGPGWGKEVPYELLDRLAGKEPNEWQKEHGYQCDVWWSLSDGVMWSFVEKDGSTHLEKLLESMQTVESEFLR